MMTTVSIIWLAIPPGLTFGEESGVSPKAFGNLQITKLGIGLYGEYGPDIMVRYRRTLDTCGVVIFM